MKPKIGFVDDDRFFARVWIEDLEELFDVIYFRSAADALVYISRTTDLRCLVLDIMMPTPSGVAETATQEGLETGLWLLREIEDFVRTYPLPVIILTNRTTTPIRDAVNELSFPDGLVEIHRKIETPRKVLRKLVISKVTSAQNPE